MEASSSSTVACILLPSAVCHTTSTSSPGLLSRTQREINDELTTSCPSISRMRSSGCNPISAPADPLETSITRAPLPGSEDTTMPSAPPAPITTLPERSEEHTSELQSRGHLVCRLLLERQ